MAGGSGVGAARARVAFKLDSAVWYIERLEEIGDEFGFDRLFGVEMALDGALTALCGAVDAAERALLRAVAQGDGWRPVSRDGRPPRRDLTRCDGLVGSAGRELEASHKEGAWLRTLRDLRNRAVHESTLARHVSVFISAEGQLTTVGLSVSGQSQPVAPPEILRQAYERARSLCGLLLDAAESVGEDPLRRRWIDRTS